MDESTSLEGYVFAQLTGGSNASIVVDLIDERVRGTCGAGGAGCPVLASQTIALQAASSSPSWQKLNLSLTGINGSTTCTNGSVRRTIIGLWVAFFQACHQSSCEQGAGPSFVRCVGRFGGGPPAYFLPPNHPYEEGVCITCTGKLPRYRWHLGRILLKSQSSRTGTLRVRALLASGASLLLDQMFLSPTRVFGDVGVARLPARLDVGHKMAEAWQALRYGGGTADGTA